MERVECTLEMMLAARDARRRRQQSHFDTNPGQTLLVATVVAPGKYKLTHRTSIIAEAEREALYFRFAGHICNSLSLDLPSGHETWLSLDIDPQEAKRIAVDIEDTHTLGRLFDIDIITSSLAPLSRTETGSAPRRCLLCGEDARVCMRAHTHTPDEVDASISRLVDAYMKT